MSIKAEESYEEKERRHHNISLMLNNYDDIFSDFDPRPYSERALSVDFLDETKRASVDKSSGGIELRMLVPANLRNAEKEKTIKKRLKAHFERHAKDMQHQHNKIFLDGAIFIFTGMVMMAFATFFLFKLSKENMLTYFLLILFEPAGWFFFWEGLHKVMFEPNKQKPDLEFYKKMARCNIYFSSY
jgi:hypothetical protein